MTKVLTEKDKRILDFLGNNPESGIYKIMIGTNITTKPETIELINDLRDSELVTTEFKNGKRIFSLKSALREIKKPKNMKSTSLIPAEPTEIIVSTPEIKISEEALQPKKEEKLQTIQEKIEMFCRRFYLIGLQKKILEALAVKPLTENEIRTICKAKSDIRGQILFLREIKLIKNVTVKGRYKINL